jgi:hypothetical protein
MSSRSGVLPRQGIQTPRYELAPPARSSLGQEAVELAASAGLVLDPWQELVLDGALGLARDGRWAASEVGLIVPRQNGKGDLGVDTPVLTTSGWSAMGLLQPGDSVFDGNGQPTRVVACSEVFEDHPCYEVTFTDGARYVAGEDHQWHVFDKDGGSWRNRSTRWLADRVGHIRPDNQRWEYRFRVRCDAVPQTPDAELPIDPYLFGYWLGDGNSRRACITVGSEDREWVCGRIEAAGAQVIRVSRHDHGGAWALNFRLKARMRDGFESRCRRLGVWGNKHIPDSYLCSSPAQRRALLAGLVDSDGSIAITNRSPQVEWGSSYPTLARSFHCLARSLGIRVLPRGSATSLNGKRCRDRTRFLWTPPFNPFELPRKAARFRLPASNRHTQMSITGIRRVATQPTRCIQVANSDGVFLVGQQFTPTHNSVLEARELAGLYLFDEALILHSAHEFKTAAEAFRRILSLIQNTPDLDRLVQRIRTSHGDEGIELRSGQRLRFVARSTGSGRGFSGDCVILDEAYRLPNSAMAALLPTMAARPNPQLWYTSSAPLPIEESDTLRRLCKRGRDGAREAMAA